MEAVRCKTGGGHLAPAQRRGYTSHAHSVPALPRPHILIERYRITRFKGFSAYLAQLNLFNKVVSSIAIHISLKRLRSQKGNTMDSIGKSRERVVRGAMDPPANRRDLCDWRSAEKYVILYRT